jgi:hypothetical protein
MVCCIPALSAVCWGFSFFKMYFALPFCDYRQYFHLLYLSVMLLAEAVCPLVNRHQNAFHLLADGFLSSAWVDHIALITTFISSSGPYSGGRRFWASLYCGLCPFLESVYVSVIIISIFS